jgi:hypothetical protein
MGLKRTALKRGNKPLKRTALRRITPKQAKRLRQQAQGTQQAVIEAGGICPECGEPFKPWNPAGRHHPVPRGLGGRDDQVQELCCMLCHEKKKGGLSKAAEQDKLK